MPFRHLIVFALLVNISCRHKNNHPAELYGRWILDSTSGKNDRIISGGPRGHTEFTLRPDKSFDFKWSDFDVLGDYSGTYNYQKPAGETIPILVFSIYSPGTKDSIIRKDTMIVLSLSDTLLKTQETERYTLLDSTRITKNRINVYRKK